MVSMKTGFFILLIFILSFNSRAQLCTGSLGDPVVHISFGAGSSQGSQLPGATTTYGFINGDCPNDGYYTVGNSTTNCFNSSWHNLSEDHTPNDVNGYFMLVNASYQPGDFFLDTVRGLCPNTTYEFAAWVVNVLKTSACSFNGIDPNLTFKIETSSGTVLATYNTGNIAESPTPFWKQYGIFFQTPTNTTSVVVRITNNAPGGCGNDIALDDITFRPCGPSVNAALAVNGDTTANICQGDTSSFLLNATYTTEYINPVFQWQVSTDGNTWRDINGATQTTYLRFSTAAPGTYRYRLSTAESGNIGLSSCRVASNWVSIYVNALPVVQMSKITESCIGTTVTLSASGGATYQWSGPNGFTGASAQVNIPNVKSSDAGTYYLSAISDKGCSKDDSTNLRVNPLPTASVNGTTEFCEGASTQLFAGGGISYSWSPSAGLSNTSSATPLASPIDTTTYKVKVFNQFGCADSALITINIWKKPVANAGPDKKTKEEIPIKLEGSAVGTDVNFNWSPPSFLDHPDIINPTTSSNEDIVYTLIVSSNKGCGISSDEVFVKVYKNVKVPNAFSPNGDGINDLWMIKGLSSYPDADLQVYNRYGQAIYRSKSYTTPWNGTYKGTILPVGTYYYVIDLKIGEPVIGGWVFILR